MCRRPTLSGDPVAARLFPPLTAYGFSRECSGHGSDVQSNRRRAIRYLLTPLRHHRERNAAQHWASRSKWSSLVIRERTATVLQPDRYGSVSSGTGDAAKVKIVALGSHIPIRIGTHQDSRKPTRSWSTKAVRIRSSALELTVAALPMPPWHSRERRPSGARGEMNSTHRGLSGRLQLAHDGCRQEQRPHRAGKHCGPVCSLKRP